jgi:hypothetical protein
MKMDNAMDKRSSLIGLVFSDKEEKPYNFDTYWAGKHSATH